MQDISQRCIQRGGGGMRAQPLPGLMKSTISPKEKKM